MSAFRYQPYYLPVTSFRLRISFPPHTVTEIRHSQQSEYAKCQNDIRVDKSCKMVYLEYDVTPGNKRVTQV